MMLHSHSYEPCAYVVVDFEATCDEPVNPDPQEIIEFPAVLVRPDGTIGETFHSFVRPVIYPQLSAFCTNLTGIDQTQVNSADRFVDVLAKFDLWRRDHVPTPWRLATCGNWDFGHLFPHQCATAGIPVPDWATRWFNVKSAFRSRHLNLPRMLDLLDLPFLGRWHSGLDDAHNIARIVQELFRRYRAGDHRERWVCPNCDAHNPATQADCRECARSRPGGSRHSRG